MGVFWVGVGLLFLFQFVFGVFLKNNSSILSIYCVCCNLYINKLFVSTTSGYFQLPSHILL